MTANSQMTGQGQSHMTIEWTNQHGCGPNADADPSKFTCNIVLQYMCQVDADTPTGMWTQTATKLCFAPIQKSRKYLYNLKNQFG